MPSEERSLSGTCLAEAVGTFILVFFGCGAVHAAVLTGAQSGLWQVAIVWGVAVALAVFVVGGISGGHINPAITVALAAWGHFSWRRVMPYVTAQIAGAFLAAATLFLLFSSFLAAKEAEKAVTRGEAGSELTAMCYGEYFPNPGPLAAAPGPYSQLDHIRFNDLVSEPVAFAAEVMGTLLLALVVFALSDERNLGAPLGRTAPLFIGLAVALLISVIAPLTQACFNPARDFGPRLFACLAGWGPIALPGPRGAGFLTVYIVAPVTGAVAGGALYQLALRPFLPLTEAEKRETRS